MIAQLRKYIYMCIISFFYKNYNTFYLVSMPISVCPFC